MLREIKAVSPSPHVITITAFGSIDTAIRAVKLGAYDYITKPFEVDQLILSVEKALDERELRSRGGAAARRGRAQLPLRQHHRQVGGDAGGVRSDPARRRLAGVGAGHRRVGHRQGAGRARDPLQQPAQDAPVRRRSTAPPSPTRCSRASCSATSAAPSPTRAPIAPACSSRPTAARSSSTRSPSCRPRCRPSCCACCRSARCGRSAPRAPRRSTCA